MLHSHYPLNIVGWELFCAQCLQHHKKKYIYEGTVMEK